MHPLIAALAAPFVFSLSLLAHAASPIYPDVTRAAADVDAAIALARGSGRRVLVSFGGNWCGDCRVLDANFHKAQIASLLEKHFVLVHVNVGDRGIDSNFAIADRYGIPLKKGVPALAVLDGEGRLVYSQKNGEFESMSRMDPAAVNDFLRKWTKPAG